MKHSFRVLLCDDHDGLRSLCREMLAEAPHIQIVGEADGGFVGIEMALALVPDLVLMDVDMPDLDGIEATRRILAAEPDIKVLAYSVGSSWHIAQKMLSAGASGYMVKGDDPDDLIGAIHAVMGGGRFLSGRIQVPVNAVPKPDRAPGSASAIPETPRGTE